MPHKPLYAVVAKRDGSTRMRFVHSFGFLEDPKQLVDRVHARLLVDPQFRTFWRGWVFGAMLADYLLRVDPGGNVMLFKDEKEKLST